MTDRDFSRRDMMAGTAVGLATAGIAAPAAAQRAKSAAGAALPDPRTRYPRPPFDTAMQPFPGLAGKMTPRPDHGETSYVGSGRLTGRRALVTGGDSGIGRAAAIAFAREGADVAISYLPAEEADAREVVALIRQAGRKALALPGDIQDERWCSRMVAQTVRELGGLDLLVNNAGRQQQRQALADLSSEDFDATMKTNIYAMFWITKAALPHMPAGASIIQTTSEQAYDPSANLVDYAMTKAAMMNFTKSLAKQLGPKGIRVNGVAPGPIWTPLQAAGGATAEKLREFGGDTSLGRPGQPVELGSIFVQLAANDATFSTGQVYGAAGGTGQP